MLAIAQITLGFGRGKDQVADLTVDEGFGNHFVNDLIDPDGFANIFRKLMQSFSFYMVFRVSSFEFRVFIVTRNDKRETRNTYSGLPARR